MKTQQIAVYEYDELDAKAQEKARDWFRESLHEAYSWGDEALKSLQALAEHFSGRLARYEIDFTGAYSPSFARFEMPEMPATEIQSRLDRLGSYDTETLKGHGDCKLTGYSADEDAIDGFRRAWILDKETDLDALMQSAFQSWLKACIADCEYQNSDEQIADTIRANEYGFTKEGKRSVTI